MQIEKDECCLTFYIFFGFCPLLNIDDRTNYFHILYEYATFVNDEVKL